MQYYLITAVNFYDNSIIFNENNYNNIIIWYKMWRRIRRKSPSTASLALWVCRFLSDAYFVQINYIELNYALFCCDRIGPTIAIWSLFLLLLKIYIMIYRKYKLYCISSLVIQRKKKLNYVNVNLVLLLMWKYISLNVIVEDLFILEFLLAKRRVVCLFIFIANSYRFYSIWLCGVCIFL